MATRFKLRIYLLALLMMVGVATLVVRLYEVQINQYDKYFNQLPGVKEVTVRETGVRGEIMDRNGMTLATNRASYEVTFDLKAIYDDYKNKNDGDVPMHFFEAKDRGMARNKKEADILKIVEETVLPHMYKLGLATDFNARKLQIHFRSTRGVVPYTYRRDLSFKDFAMFAENDFSLPGVDVTVKPSRIYPFDSLGSHILGYVKLPDIEKVPIEKRREFDHYVPDDYGGAGIEKSMDHHLQGRPGKRVLRKDEKGIIRGEIAYEPPKPGADVYLTLDSRIQYITENALRAIGRGAAVVVDPRNGDILSMASVPSYNPNNFIPSVSEEDWKRYTSDKSSPMFNRALSQHPPGSTFKIPIALSGFLSDSHRRNYYCGGGVQYGAKFMKCWIYKKGGRHGSIGMKEAIKRSCNCYFYLYANDTGINNIVEVTNKMGLGRKTGIPLDGEAPGLVPSPQWLKLQGLLWSDAFTAMTGIGQGYAEATPLQMASATATVANGGKVFQPRIVKQVIEKDGTVVVPDEPKLLYDLEEEGLTEAELALAKDGMRAVVNDPGGTASRAKSENFIVSGKTGTAQTGNMKEPTNAWFISFAPYDVPELAVCVFVHNGDSGGRCAAPIAGHIVKQVMAMKHGYDPELKPLEEASGHFDRIEMVSFDNEDLNRFHEGDDADGAVELPDGFSPTVQSTRSTTPTSSRNTPTIRARSDYSVKKQQQKVYQAEKVDRWKKVRQAPSPTQRPKTNPLQKFNPFRKKKQD